jgi:ParB family chromosome partitioning protein
MKKTTTLNGESAPPAGPRTLERSPKVRRKSLPPTDSAHRGGRKGNPKASPSRGRATGAELALLPAQLLECEWSHCHPERLADEAFQALKQSIAKSQRNRVPILVRPTGDTVTVSNRVVAQYQIVYGRRRALACSQLGKPVYALVREMDDHSAAAYLHAENSFREGLSAFERGNLYDSLISDDDHRHSPAQHLFRTQLELATALNVDAGDVSRCRFLARLPAEILAIVESPRDLAVHDADALRVALKSHPAEVLRRAAAIAEADGKLKARTAVKRLTDFRAHAPKHSALERRLEVDAVDYGRLRISASRLLSIEFSQPLTEAQLKRVESALQKALRVPRR